MKNYLLFSFLKYKNRSSSSSIATKKKKKKRKQLFSLKNLSFFSKKLRHLYESIPPFCFLLRRSVSFLHRRARAPWYVSLWLRSFVWADVSCSYNVCVCVYAESIAINQISFLSPIICLLFSIGDFFLRSYFVSDRVLVRDSDSNFLAFLKLVQQMLAPRASICNT